MGGEETKPKKKITAEKLRGAKHKKTSN